MHGRCTPNLRAPQSTTCAGDSDLDGTEWGDQERRLQQPAVEHDSPEMPRKQPSTPGAVHAPGDTLQAPGRGTTEALRAPGDPVQRLRQGSGGADQLQAPGKTRVPGRVREDLGTITDGRAGDHEAHEDMCVDVDRIWFAFGSPVTVYSLPEVWFSRVHCRSKDSEVCAVVLSLLRGVLQCFCDATAVNLFAMRLR
jgi:hypothetical protein